MYLVGRAFFHLIHTIKYHENSLFKLKYHGIRNGRYEKNQQINTHQLTTTAENYVFLFGFRPPSELVNHFTQQNSYRKGEHTRGNRFATSG